MSLILASASPIRRALLGQAGIAHRIVPAAVDEAPIKADHGDPENATRALAEAKARAVSNSHPGDWVLGGDSMVTVGKEMFDKPADRDDAADHLRRFSGQSMVLTSAASLARNGAVEWSLADQARLKVRELSEDFIQRYLDSEWPEVAYCVGVFRLEGPGVQLFDSIEGDYFTVLGLPLLPVLGALRARGLAPR